MGHVGYNPVMLLKQQQDVQGSGDLTWGWASGLSVATVLPAVGQGGVATEGQMGLGGDGPGSGSSLLRAAQCLFRRPGPRS